MGAYFTGRIYTANLTDVNIQLYCTEYSVNDYVHTQLGHGNIVTRDTPSFIHSSHAYSHLGLAKFRIL